MKIIESFFGKERKELEKFNKLDLDERSIVFYSENSVLLYPYVEQIIKELEKRDQKICYVTSSKDDPIFKNENKKIKSFYIGDGSVKYKFFWELKAKVIIMTMPDLENYWIKRSIVFPVHYIYIFHSMNSTHMAFQKEAFDRFNTIFCVGQYQIQEIRATEQLYNLKQKNLVEYGYGLLDKLLKSRPSHSQQNFLSKNNKKKILIAPSWGKQNLLESTGIELIKILLDAGYHVTVRPHPMTIKKSKKVIQKIEKEFKDNLNFKLETDIRNMESFFLCDCMISDLSGAAIEYSFTFEKPILYIVTPEKIVQEKQIDLVSLEEKIRPQIGEVITLSQLSLLPSKINQFLLSQNKFKEKIKKIREETVFNIGNSADQGAKYLLELKKSLES